MSCSFDGGLWPAHAGAEPTSVFAVLTIRQPKLEGATEFGQEYRSLNLAQNIRALELLPNRRK